VYSSAEERDQSVKGKAHDVGTLPPSKMLCTRCALSRVCSLNLRRRAQSVLCSRVKNFHSVQCRGHCLIENFPEEDRGQREQCRAHSTYTLHLRRKVTVYNVGLITL
jgi:hypothetical protein